MAPYFSKLVSKLWKLVSERKYALTPRKSGPKKPVTARDVTGFYALFSARKSGDFLHVLGCFSYQIAHKILEKQGKIHWRKFKKSSGDGAPKLQISVPYRGQTCPEKICTNFLERIFLRNSGQFQNYGTPPSLGGGGVHVFGNNSRRQTAASWGEGTRNCKNSPRVRFWMGLNWVGPWAPVDPFEWVDMTQLKPCQPFP